MTDPMHQQLLGHLLGELDDDEREWLETRLQHDDEYRRHCLSWRRRLAPLDAMLPEFEPPPGLAERTCRLVAAFATAVAPLQAATAGRKMSPEPPFPTRAASLAWRDVAAVAVLMVTFVALLLPAIYSSRFQARLAACQNNLRQFGLALAEYSHDHGDAVSRLAAGGRLTGAGVFAAGVIDDRFATGSGRGLCPDAWLAAQGAYNVAGTNVAGTLRVPSALRVPSVSLDPIRVGRFAATIRGFGPQAFSELQSQGVDNSAVDWSDRWRTGTTDGRQGQPLPAALPLLADAPSADLPGQSADYHDGRGRNVFFADGEVRFLPCSAPPDAAEMVLSGGQSFVAPDGSTPITFVSGHRLAAGE